MDQQWEENDCRNYFMINLHESMGPGQAIGKCEKINFSKFERISYKCSFDGSKPTLWNTIKRVKKFAPRTGLTFCRPWSQSFLITNLTISASVKQFKSRSGRTFQISVWPSVNSSICLYLSCSTFAKIRLQKFGHIAYSNVELNVDCLAQHSTNSGSEVWRYS